MALARKKSRTVVVDGVTYRWRVRRRPTYSQGMGWSTLAYAVARAEEPGSTLLVRTGRAHPGQWLGGPGAVVLPGEVARAVRTGIAAGWRPERAGVPVRVELDSTPPDPG
ncbi:hypothetical protein [Streptomyces purpureus]|uniref:Uncharacterized protein n=1 Tax=Streptomyces purpureus TaxID=1951 RepID=A0A918H1T4_9ACTN|nr:hypothetical protein [Streptomyces purpureus]GGT31803.1 hypothetical protein GCM10014713_26770 [Streptomyces purpureus]